MSEMQQSVPCEHKSDWTSCDTCNPCTWRHHYEVTARMHDKFSKLQAENQRLRELVSALENLLIFERNGDRDGANQTTDRIIEPRKEY